MKKLYNKDNTYHKLSVNSYNPNIIKKQTTRIKNQNNKIQNFKIQASRVDKGNGFQGMAVSPIDSDGKVDNDTVYMVYAGTDPKENSDLGTDLNLGLSSVFDHQMKSNPKDVKLYNQYKDLDKNNIDYKYPDNTAKNSQFDEANVWTEEVLKKGNYKHVYGTGHSLGGTIAQVMAVMHDFDQTKTFSAPNGYDLLPDNVKQNFDAKKFEKKIVDYTHTSDAIGMYDLGKHSIGMNIFVEDVKPQSLSDQNNPAFAHGLKYFSFSGDNVKIKIDSDKAKRIAEKLNNDLKAINTAIKKLEHYQENSKRRARNIEEKYKDQISSGDFKYIHASDIENYMDELTKSNKYDFFDTSKFDDTLSVLHSHKKQLERLAEKIVDAGQKMENRDKELSEIYKYFEEE
ncbi:hypothetical protein ABH521_000020 [Staphylococcus warneri]|uniref:hypothetical protein n=1 Tax=Staphylococcus warneri TaxID=1292 RepID=UPI0032610348